MHHIEAHVYDAPSRDANPSPLIGHSLIYSDGPFIKGTEQLTLTALEACKEDLSAKAGKVLELVGETELAWFLAFHGHKSKDAMHAYHVVALKQPGSFEWVKVTEQPVELVNPMNPKDKITRNQRIEQLRHPPAPALHVDHVGDVVRRHKRGSSK